MSSDLVLLAYPKCTLKYLANNSNNLLDDCK